MTNGQSVLPVKTVLFDLDGTFADTAPDLSAALNHARAARDLPPLPLATLRPQASHGSRGLLKIGFGLEPGDPDYDTLRDIFLDHYEHNICTHTRLFSGMTELIDELTQRAIPWGIVTNKPHRFTLPLMQALGYADRAACLVSGDTCPQAKPHPLPLLHAARLTATAPQQCLYLGDDLRDMQAAAAAGMTGLVARYGYVDATFETWPSQGSLNNPLELLSYLAH